MILARIIDLLRQRFGFARPTPVARVSRPPAPALQPQRQPAAPPAPAPAPAPASKLSAVEILRNEPKIKAPELAERAGVTLAYANSLIRKKRPRPVSVATTPVRPAAVPTPVVEGNIHLSQIAQAAAAGGSIGQIAEQLSLVPGEVEFVLKMARLKKNLKV